MTIPWLPISFLLLVYCNCHFPFFFFFQISFATFCISSHSPLPWVKARISSCFSLFDTKIFLKWETETMTKKKHYAWTTDYFFLFHKMCFPWSNSITFFIPDKKGFLWYKGNYSLFIHLKKQLLPELMILVRSTIPYMINIFKTIQRSYAFNND